MVLDRITTPRDQTPSGLGCHHLVSEKRCEAGDLRDPPLRFSSRQSHRVAYFSHVDLRITSSMTSEAEREAMGPSSRASSGASRHNRQPHCLTSARMRSSTVPSRASCPIWIDAADVKVRQSGRIVPKTIIVAINANSFRLHPPSRLSGTRANPVSAKPGGDQRARHAAAEKGIDTIHPSRSRSSSMRA